VKENIPFSPPPCASNDGCELTVSEYFATGESKATEANLPEALSVASFTFKKNI